MQNRLLALPEAWKIHIHFLQFLLQSYFGSFLWLITPRLLGGRYAGRHCYPKDSLNLLHLASGFGPEHIKVKANAARGGEEQL